MLAIGASAGVEELAEVAGGGLEGAAEFIHGGRGLANGFHHRLDAVLLEKAEGLAAGVAGLVGVEGGMCHGVRGEQVWLRRARCGG